MNDPRRFQARSAPPPAFDARTVPVTVAIIAVNVAVFLLENLWGGSQDTDTLVRMGAVFSHTVPEFRAPSMLSYAYLHIGLAHIGMNMLALWNTGRFIEPFLGASRFFSLYTLSAIGGGVLVAASPGVHVTAGASGAIFGIMGAVLVLMLRRYRATPSLEEKSMLRGSIARMLGPNILISLLPGVSFLGHAGGLAVGAAFMVGVLVVGHNRVVRDETRPVVHVAAVLLALVTVACVAAQWMFYSPWARAT